MALEMSLKSSVTAKLSLPCSSPQPKGSNFKTRLRAVSMPLPTPTAISLLALFNPPHEAKAVTIAKDQIVYSLTEVEKTIDQVQEVGSNVLDTAQQFLQALGEALKPAIDKALPLAQQAGEEALKIASPTLSEASKKAQEAMRSSGFDAEPVMKTATKVAQQTTKVIEGAKPIASSTFDTVCSADPSVVVITAGALLLSYLLLPPIWSVISFNLRGFRGELTPAQTLDLMCTKNYLMIDIRSEKDKDKAGVPRLPSAAKSKMIAIPLEELPSKLRGLVRNVKRVEAEIAALKISYLKKINKGSNIIIMDSFSDAAKTVARTLTSLGFKNCWIVSDGFSGSRGWLQSRLGTDTYNLSFPQVLSPSRIITSAARSFGTTTGTKFLPGAD